MTDLKSAGCRRCDDSGLAGATPAGARIGQPREICTCPAGATVLDQRARRGR